MQYTNTFNSGPCDSLEQSTIAPRCFFFKYLTKYVENLFHNSVGLNVCHQECVKFGLITEFSIFSHDREKWHTVERNLTFYEQSTGVEPNYLHLVRFVRFVAQ